VVQHHGGYANLRASPSSGTKQPVGPDDLTLSSHALIEQERQRSWINIPRVSTFIPLEALALFRAHRLERRSTLRKIYYKYEGVSLPAATSQTRHPPGFLYKRQASSASLQDGCGQWGIHGACGKLFGLMSRVHGEGSYVRNLPENPDGDLGPRCMQARRQSRTREGRPRKLIRTTR